MEPVDGQRGRRRRGQAAAADDTGQARGQAEDERDGAGAGAFHGGTSMVAATPAERRRRDRAFTHLHLR
ncbi:MAG: hypothetical protein E6J20_20730 [Chloroflexi bacterium]|nr:MAG: hypothetical protein E6J20_20730 [Chloroflexota bacterium]